MARHSATRVDDVPDASSTSGEGRPTRKDAQRNRELLMSAAAEMFARSGVDAPLEDVARHAGVGIGTLYRNFPTRVALVEAVYRRGVAELCDSAGVLLRSLPPEEALAAWMRNYVAYVATKRGLSATLREMMAAEPGLFAETRVRITEAAETMLVAGAKVGAVRSDVDAEDLLRAMSGICMVTEDEDHGEAAAKLMSILVDGLRYAGLSQLNARD